MSEISATTIAISRYAPAGSNAIELFNVNGAENLTLGQMIISVCMRRATYLERDSVVYENQLLARAEAMEVVANYIDEVTADTISQKRWAEIRADLIERYDEFTAEGLTASIVSTLDSNKIDWELRMSALDNLRTGLTTINSSIDRLAIDLESLVSRRDTVYNTATTTVVHTGKTGANMAALCK